MRDCYLCGRKIIKRPSDYDLNRSEHQGLAIKHKEHIIQNSIHGKLTDDNILCEECGGKLSKSVDSAFVKLFQGITERLKPVLG